MPLELLSLVYALVKAYWPLWLLPVDWLRSVYSLYSTPAFIACAPICLFSVADAVCEVTGL